MWDTPAESIHLIPAMIHVTAPPNSYRSSDEDLRNHVITYLSHAATNILPIYTPIWKRRHV